jgi:hypothetical protein
MDAPELGYAAIFSYPLYYQLSEHLQAIVRRQHGALRRLADWTGWS